MKKIEEKVSTDYKTNADILKIRNYDSSLNAFVMEDGTYLNVWKKTEKDIDNMLEDEIEILRIQFAKFLKLYKDDFNIIAINYPTSTQAQQQYYENVKKRTPDPIRRKWIDRTIEELKLSAKGTNKRAFYFIVFSKTKTEHEEHTRLMKSLGREIEEIDIEEKIKVIYKLCNMNSLILSEK